LKNKIYEFVSDFHCPGKLPRCSVMFEKAIAQILLSHYNWQGLGYGKDVNNL